MYSVLPDTSHHHDLRPRQQTSSVKCLATHLTYRENQPLSLGDYLTSSIGNQKIDLLLFYSHDVCAIHQISSRPILVAPCVFRDCFFKL